MSDAVHAEGVTYRYGERVALNGLSLTVPAGGVFGLLGPNGSGKTTLFRLLDTDLTPQQGTLRLAGLDVRGGRAEVRRRIGVVFQSPSLDPHLSVGENLHLHARLYGLSAADRKAAVARWSETFGVADRLAERVARLSGGLARRVELAKCMLHAPRILILDEPSTGLDPAARGELWRSLRSLVDDGVTVLLTTHLMDEADRCDRLAILDRGAVVAAGTPQALRAELGGAVLTLTVADGAAAAAALSAYAPDRHGDELRLTHGRPESILPDVLAALPQPPDALTLARPSLEDVFLARTGRRFEVA